MRRWAGLIARVLLVVIAVLLILFGLEGILTEPKLPPDPGAFLDAGSTPAVRLRLMVAYVRFMPGLPWSLGFVLFSPMLQTFEGARVFLYGTCASCILNGILCVAAAGFWGRLLPFKKRESDAFRPAGRQP